MAAVLLLSAQDVLGVLLLPAGLLPVLTLASVADAALRAVAAKTHST